MFASRVTKNVTIERPEGAVVVTIRKLSGKSLTLAGQQQGIAKARAAGAIGGDALTAFMQMESLKEAAAAGKPAPDADPELRARARYAEYDREAVLQAGIVSWTPADPTAPELPTVNPDAIADLDEDVAALLHREVLDLSLPPIDKAEREAAGKDDSGACTAS